VLCAVLWRAVVNCQKWAVDFQRARSNLIKMHLSLIYHKFLVCDAHRQLLQFGEMLQLETLDQNEQTCRQLLSCWRVVGDMTSMFQINSCLQQFYLLRWMLLQEELFWPEHSPLMQDVICWDCWRQSWTNRISRVLIFMPNLGFVNPKLDCLWPADFLLLSTPMHPQPLPMQHNWVNSQESWLTQSWIC